MFVSVYFRNVGRVLELHDTTGHKSRIVNPTVQHWVHSHLDVRIPETDSQGFTHAYMGLSEWMGLHTHFPG